MQRDAADILDRWAIACIKIEWGGGEAAVEERKIFDVGIKELKEKYPQYDWNQFGEYMKTITRDMFEHESDIRKGALDKDFEETGRRAIATRKTNKFRTDFKNIINKLVGEGTQNIKVNHLST